MFNHEEKCPFQKIKYSHFPWEYSFSLKRITNYKSFN